MCGIAVILRQPGTGVPPGTLEAMTRDVTHRGPDGEGILYLDVPLSGPSHTQTKAAGPWNVGLGHRRLAILDLSPSGRQPMPYRDALWIVYNGEVYNYVELRNELQRRGHSFHSTSDTEVILAAYQQWGPDSFQRFRGMWGFVIIDIVRGEAVLCRDHLGIKPLYLWRHPGMIAVVSEIKQLCRLPGFRARAEPLAAAEYLQTGYEDPGRSLFADVQPVPAGSWLRIPLDSLQPCPPNEYWQPEQINVSVRHPLESSRLFADKFRECVRIYLRSDVPVGCALSGGLDSSAIAVLISALKKDQGEPLHSFTACFPGEPIDEGGYAQTVVDGIRAQPHRVTPTPGEFLNDLDRFLWIQDEPVGSFAMYAGYCVARLARQEGVPVTLNGQGGDELLGGYWQYYFMYLRELALRGHWLDMAGHFFGALLGNGNRELVRQIPAMLHRYRARSHPAQLVRLRRDVGPSTSRLLEATLSLRGQARRVNEIRHLMLPRLLKWDDRSFMAFAVEGRYPFLDPELIELCLTFAPETLYHRGWTKRPLRLGLGALLPAEIASRRTKWGFVTPQDSWLCGPLRPPLERWLNEDRPVWTYVEPQDVRSLAEHTWRAAGRHVEPGQALYRVFLFDRWLELFHVAA